MGMYTIKELMHMTLDELSKECNIQHNCWSCEIGRDRCNRMFGENSTPASIEFRLESMKGWLNEGHI